MNPVGIILAGGPFRDYKNFAPYDEELFDLDIPILGIGHGMQVMAHHFGGNVSASEVAESTMGKMEVVEDTHLFEGFEKSQSVVVCNGGRVLNVRSEERRVGKECRFWFERGRSTGCKRYRRDVQRCM